MILRFIREEADDGQEPLALQNHLDLEDEAKKTGEYDALHDEVQELITEDEELDAEDVTSSDDSGGDSPPEDDTSGEEPPADDADPDADPDAATADDEAPPEDPKDSKEAPVDDGEIEDPQEDRGGKKQTAVTESLRNEYYDRMALEAITFDDVKNVASKGWEATSYMAGVLKQLAVVLFAFGVKYYPTVARHIKKTVIYLYTKSAKALLKTIIVIADFTKRHVRSFNRGKSQIRQLREELENLKQKADGNPIEMVKDASSDQNLISWLTASGKTDAALTVKEMNVFLDTVVQQIDAGISNDLNSVKKLIELSDSNLSGNPIEILDIRPFHGRFLSKAMPANHGEEVLITSQVYSSVLPNQVLFVANLPKAHLKEMDAISRAYGQSGVFLTADNRQPPTSQKVDYMDIEGIASFLDGLEGLCDKALAHTAFYKRISKQSDSLKFGYRHYYQKLTQTAREATVRDTLVEYVYLKQSFAMKVYLPAAMDVHDYTAAYLVRAIRFARDNLKQLRVVPKDLPPDSR